MTPGALLSIAGLAMILGLLAGFRAPRAWLCLTVIGAAAIFSSAVLILIGGSEWNWEPEFFVGGEPVHLRLDAISAFFLALLAVIGGAGALYSREYWCGRDHPESARAGRAWWNALLGFMTLVLLSSNGLHFLIAWELFAVSAYFLITLRRDSKEVRKAGWLYLAASHAGTLCLFAFFSLLAARTGSWELHSMRDHPELAPLFWLALAGFGIKAGLFPLHIWLPSAHANAPSHISAILSGVAIKMGIYGIVRFSGWLPLPEASGWVVAGLGMISAVLGVVFALGQHDLKRLLAYHSVENIGIILIGLGFAMIAATHGNPAWGWLALAGGLLHVWNHGLFKALLFLGAGSVLHSTGTREMSRLGGLWRKMPWTAGLFMLGAAAISGLPPLNGFISEWLVYLGLFEATAAHNSVSCAAVPAAIFLAMTGALALACFVKVCGIVFLGLPRTEAARHAHENGWRMRAPMVVLAAACAAIGLVPFFFWPAVAHATAAWQPAWSQFAAPEPLFTLGGLNAVLAVIAVLAAVLLWQWVRHNGIERAPTWDCGYSAPTPRIQYTAGSFAGIITGWFRWILLPESHLHSTPAGPASRRRPAKSSHPDAHEIPTIEPLFPARADFAEHTPETVLEKIVQPAGSIVMRISTAVRRLQHGRLQAYILYLLIGVAALVCLALMGGGK